MKPLTTHQRLRLLDPRHWSEEYYVQRCERKLWSYVLLYNMDIVLFEGRTRQLVGKSIGAGIWEIRKS